MEIGSHIQHGAIIFDGDDTLWKTQELYDRVKSEFSKLLHDCSFAVDNPIQLLDKIDSERVPEFGFTASRFVTSLIITYQVICKMENRNPESKIEQQLRLKSGIILGLPELYNDTLWCLKSLRSNYSLILATKGNSVIQENKIDQLKLRDYFSKIYLLKDKSEFEYNAIIKENNFPKSRIWIVGNSIKSDINPGLKLKLRSILIPRGIWRYEESSLIEGDLTVAPSLSEVVRIILLRDSLFVSGSKT